MNVSFASAAVIAPAFDKSTQSARVTNLLDLLVRHRDTAPSPITLVFTQWMLLTVDKDIAARRLVHRFGALPVAIIGIRNPQG